jgi:hypothetical protein
LIQNKNSNFSNTLESWIVCQEGVAAGGECSGYLKRIGCPKIVSGAQVRSTRRSLDVDGKCLEVGSVDQQVAILLLKSCVSPAKRVNENLGERDYRGDAFG